LSLEDGFSKEEMAEWERRLKKLTSAPFEYFSELKIDGFAVSLVYEHGVLKVGATRGDGVTGEDVTQNLKTIEAIPLRLRQAEKEIENIIGKKLPAAIESYREIEVRGEVYMTKKAFEKVNREQEKKGLALYANPRNLAAGSVRQLDPKITASRELSFFAYDLVTDFGQETHEEEHEICRALGFRTLKEVKRSKNLNEVQAFFASVKRVREKLPYEIDGIVVQVNENRVLERLGAVGKSPRGMIAYKFPGKEATTIIEDIFVQVGRTGVLTPVAALKPVEVGGVTVSRATLHNMDEIERLGVKIGDTVIIQRAGDVIPDIVRVLPKLRPKHARAFRMPKTFCGQPVIRREGEVAHRIPHPEKCPLVHRERLYHFVSKKAFDIERLGPKIIDQLVENNLIQDPADIFALKVGDLVPLERFAEKSAQNIIESIEAAKKITLPRFIFALGIPHVGEETAQDLAKELGSIEKLMDASKEELDAIPEVGSVMAEEIAKWFGNRENRDLLRKLLRYVGIERMHVTKKGPLEGKTMVVTGGLRTMSREEAKEKIREAGGDVSESVSRKTDFLVFGSEPGSKYEKAKKLRVNILTEKEFLQLLE
ncbi:NAD-dependent DNA ligase LigA, partial [Candidatus Azambacteria bacterium]|nr:NAD-dependent DNA ligase LigA [Candidatus Azambacteria bacterium]